jgi:hypothetical protein
MKFWFSGEIQIDVHEGDSAASAEVVAALNQGLGAADFGAELTEWDLIPMITPEPKPGYKEVRKYHTRDKSIEFRLKIDRTSFKETDDLGRRRLVVGSLLRSLDEARRGSSSDSPRP